MAKWDGWKRTQPMGSIETPESQIEFMSNLTPSVSTNAGIQTEDMSNLTLSLSTNLPPTETEQYIWTSTKTPDPGLCSEGTC